MDPPGHLVPPKCAPRKKIVSVLFSNTASG